MQVRIGSSTQPNADNLHSPNPQTECLQGACRTIVTEDWDWHVHVVITVCNEHHKRPKGLHLSREWKKKTTVPHLEQQSRTSVKNGMNKFPNNVLPDILFPVGIPVN